MQKQILHESDDQVFYITVFYITAYSLTHKTAILDPVDFSDDVCAIIRTMLIYI